ncbi:unnamed protein product [Prorocentrum cordatum]|uniref:Uncharacterized protein n=1 Tax=Prorocentrum cordatum TaxID=2364126 RepID=A0ABN9SNW7_9DINO|nr:unnamed protein product [Polarella glacialis]
MPPWGHPRSANARPFGRAADSNPDDAAVRRLASYVEEHADELESQRVALVAAAEREYDSLLQACRVPLTRAQWAQWLDENMEQFAEKMESAPGRRRARNQRLRARHGLPAPAARLGPEGDQWRPCATQWGAILERRSGWHGIRVHPDRKHMLFLYTLAGRTYAIDVEPFSTGALLKYNIFEDFDVAAAIRPLAVLEDVFTDAAVRGVFGFRMRGGPAPGGGLLLAAEAGRRLTEQLPRPRRAAEPSDDDASDGSGSEGSAIQKGLGGDGGSSEDDVSGLSDSSRVVDTDADSALEGSSVESDSAPESGGEPANSDAPLAVHLRDLPGLGPEEGGWGKNRSKTLTPAHYGESRANPVRSIITLRSWMRRRAGANGWSAAHPGRAREFAEEAARLQREIQDLQPQAGGLLGNAKADALIRQWVPGIVANL